MQFRIKIVGILAIVAMGLAGPVAVVADCEAADPALKADLSLVVSSGEVIPVSGMTTAGQPDAAALAVFAGNGYVTVIDLRTPGEDRGLDEQATVESLGMNYVNLPIAGANAISYENAAKLKALIAAADGPVLLHCGSANRVGALLALQRSSEGADDEAAMAFGREAGMTSLGKIVEAALEGHSTKSD